VAFYVGEAEKGTQALQFLYDRVPLIPPRLAEAADQFHILPLLDVPQLFRGCECLHLLRQLTVLAER
jgi:hypothetical protein